MAELQRLNKTCREDRRRGIVYYLDKDCGAGSEAEQQPRGDEGAVPGEPGLRRGDDDRPRRWLRVLLLQRRGGGGRGLGLGRRGRGGGRRVLQQSRAS